MGVCSSVSNICSKDIIINEVLINSVNVIQNDGHLHINKNKNNIYSLQKLINYDTGVEMCLTLSLRSNNIDSKMAGSTYKFQLFVDNSDSREEKFLDLGCTEELLISKDMTFGKKFYLKYYFTKPQIIKVTAYENSREIKTSSFYFGKMLNIFDVTRLTIQSNAKETRNELLIKINKKEDINEQNLINYVISKHSKKSDKKCEILCKISSINVEPGYYFFTVTNAKSEKLYISETFGYKIPEEKHGKKGATSLNFISTKMPDDFSGEFSFCFSTRKQYLFVDYEREASINFYDSQKQELVCCACLNWEKLLENEGVNEVKLKTGLFTDIFKDKLTVQMTYKEKDYVPFIEYIYYQLHLGLCCIFDDCLSYSEDYENIKNILTSFYETVSLYDNEMQNLKYYYMKDDNEKIKIKTGDNIENVLTELPTYKKIDRSPSKIFPVLSQYIKEFIQKDSKEGINKFHVVIIFTNTVFADVNLIEEKYETVKDWAFAVKIFNLGDDFMEYKFNANSKNASEFHRKIFDVCNIGKSNVSRQKACALLSDVPLLVEDYYEMQKETKFTIF